MKPATEPPNQTPVEEEQFDAEPENRSAVTVLAHPGIPVSMEDLAARRGEAQEIVAARAAILETLRKRALQLTSPEDWLLFRARDGSIVGYLQDAGCDRVADLFGVEVYDVTTPQKIMGDVPGEFHYIQSGAGRCRITKRNVEAIEGGRSSTDDYITSRKEPPRGVALDLAVRKACRANLNGNITRSLCGLKSVPIRELEDAWAGTKKKTADCRQGRGFGTQAERQGAKPVDPDQPKDLPVPACELCGKTMVFHKAGTSSRTNKPYPAFYSCPDNQRGPGHSTIEADVYRRNLEANRQPGSDDQ